MKSLNLYFKFQNTRIWIIAKEALKNKQMFVWVDEFVMEGFWIQI